jgi:8-amino-7-oxononanoate synthase/acyl carrier protein
MNELEPADVSKYFPTYAVPQTDLVSAAQFWAAKTPDNPVFYFTDGEGGEDVCLTYRQLDQAARAVAARLQQDGSAEGQRVLLLYPPGLDFVVGFFGTLYAGAIAVPAFPPRKNRKGARIQSIAEDCSANWALSITSVCDLIHSDESAQQDLAGATILATDQISLALADQFKPAAINPLAPAVLQYTSGSTGQPKGVVLTHACLVRNSELILLAFEPGPGGGCSWLPLYHDMGLVGGVLEPVFLGRPNVLMSPMSFLQRPARWLQTISKYRVAVSGGPNFAYQLCVDKVTDADMEGVDLSCWSVAYNGAEPVRASTLDQFTEKFAKYGFNRSAFLPCYGMAETTLIVTGGPTSSRPFFRTFDAASLDQRKVMAVPTDDGTDKCRTLVGCGAVLANENIIVVDPDTLEELPVGRVGEIWIQTPSVGKGYWRKPQESQRTFQAFTVAGRGPFLRTGDLGFLFEDQLFVAGRLKDMIIVRGVNRYPQDIEMTVEESHKSIQSGSVAAFALQVDERERLVITAEVQRGAQQNWDEVVQAIRRRVTEVHELPPEAISLVRFGTLPKTSSGKIQRHACLNDYKSNALKVVAQWKLGEVQMLKQEPMIAASTIEVPGRDGGSIKNLLKDPNLKEKDPHPEIVRVVIGAVKAVAQERAEDVNLDTNIVLDLGLDSLERLQIAHSLEQQFGGRFPEDVLQDIDTVRQVAAAIEELFGVERIHRSLTEAVAAEDVLHSREVTPEDYQFDLLPEYRRLKMTMSELLSTGVRNPYFAAHQGVVRDTTTISGRELISFASYNYLGMSGDTAVNKAVVDAVNKYGTSCSASRLVSGEKDLHQKLERRIAKWIGVEDSIVMVGGHATNESVIGHLLGPGDLILHDSLSHNSIVQGAILSGARRRAFPHNDWRALERILQDIRDKYRRVLVIVEGVYSMDGDYPELPRFVEIKQRYKSWLMVDEAHSIGTMGKTGRGISEHFGIDANLIDIWMGTLSKSFGSCGGYIAGRRELIEYLKYTTPGFVFSVGLSPSNASAALASLDVLEAEPERVEKLRHNSKLFLDEARKRGLNTGDSSGTPVVPVILGNSLVALKLADRMVSQGVNVLPILYPAVEEAAARLRFFINSTHSEEQILFAVRLVEESLRELYPDYFADSDSDRSVA